MLKVILDTNVLFSAVLTEGGIPHQIVIAAAAQAYQLVLSPYILEETRRKVAAKIKHPRKVQKLEAMLAATPYILVADPTLEEVRANLHLTPDDPNDAPIALVALREEVDVLVTGNSKHFIKSASSEFREQVQVLTPRQFFDKYFSGEG